MSVSCSEEQKRNSLQPNLEGHLGYNDDRTDLLLCGLNLRVNNAEQSVAFSDNNQYANRHARSVIEYQRREGVSFFQVHDTADMH